MNKKTLVIIGIIIFLTCLVTYANYSASVINYFSKVSDETYEISKSSNEKNQKFIDDIVNLAIANNISFYENLFAYTTNNEIGVSTYYVSDNFKTNQKFISGNNLPVDNYQNNKLKIPALYFKYEIKNFTDFAKDNPSMDQIVISVHGDTKNIDKFISTVSKSYTVKKQPSELIEHQPKIFVMYVMLYVVLLLSILFDEKNQQKKYNLQKILGYSNREILYFEIIAVIKKLSILFIVILLTFGIIVSFSSNLYLYFLLYAIKLISVLYLLIISTILIIKYNIINTKVSYIAIKGFKVTSLEKVFLNIAKVIILILLIISSVTLVEQIKEIKNNIKIVDENQVKFNGYVKLPFTTSGVAYTEQLDQQMDDASASLYQNTVLDNEGIFINADSFNQEDKYSNTEDKLLYTNKNYLNIQDIYQNKQKLSKKQLSSSDIVVLYPESKTEKSVQALVKKNLEAENENNTSYLKYDKNQLFNTFNDAVNTKNNQVKDPIIIVANNLTKEQEISAFWSDYVVKDDNINEILEKYDKHNFVKKPEYVNKIFNEKLISLKNSMKKSILAIIVSMVIIILIILFKINNYILENQKEIYIKKTLGYSTFENFKALFVSNLGLYMIICVILFIGLNIKDAVLMYSLILIVDYILMYACIINKERKSNANQIRKN